MGVMGDERDGVFVESFLYVLHLICPAFGRHCAVHVLSMPSFRSPLRSAFTLTIQQACS
jgi:hypothetical protein